MKNNTSKEHQRTELEKELAQLAILPEMNPGPVCRLNGKGIIMLANRAARTLFSEESLVNRNWLDTCPGMTTVLWNDILNSNTPFTFEADIGDRCVMFTFVRPESGDSVFVYGTDITERRKAEKELEEQAALLAEVARFPEMNPGPVIRTDLKGIILLANAAARNVFGEQLIGTYWRDILPGLDTETWNRILNAQGPIPVEAQVGERIFIFYHRRDVNGHLVFVFGADITLQKLAERTLVQTEKMATLGTVAAGAAHELNNPASATQRAADHLRKEFLKLEEVHLSLNNVNLSDAARNFIESILKSIHKQSDHITQTDTRTSMLRETAMEEWLDAHSIPNSWELAPALAQLEIDPEDLNALSATVESESFTLLLTWAACLSMVYSLLHDIGHGALRISEIVDALKIYTFLDQAPQQTVDIHDGIDKTLLILRHKLGDRITVNRLFAADVPKIAAYGSELNQVWTNLIVNAVDALGDSGEIMIRTINEGDRVRVEVEDNGPGIPEEILRRIFDPFFTTKPPGKGTGLGLSTCYSIITEKHGGSITVESRPGFTRFTVYLPVSPTVSGISSNT
jgi:signal transduction histidine kinase